MPLFILENVNEIYSVHLRNDRSLSDFIRTCDVCNSTYVGEKRTKPDESRQVPKFVRAFFMQIISIFGFKFAVIWKLPNTQETQPKMVKEAWNCDRKVQPTTYMHFVALLKFAIIYAFVKILNMYLLIKSIEQAFHTNKLRHILCDYKWNLFCCKICNIIGIQSHEIICLTITRSRNSEKKISS